MSDEPPRHKSKAAASSDPFRPPGRLIQAVRASLRATVVYATALSDRFEVACASEPAQLYDIPPDLLLHLAAVSEAFQDGARHTLWWMEPELAGRAQTIATLARDGAGDPQAEG